MATRSATRAHSSKPRMVTPSKLIPIKGSTELHRRLRIAAAEEGVSYAELLTRWLDRRDANIKRQRAAQPSPLHRPRGLDPMTEEL